MGNRAEQGYLGRLAAAKYLSVSSRLLDYVKAQGAIPFYRLSRRKVVFQVADHGKKTLRLIALSPPGHHFICVLPPHAFPDAALNSFDICYIFS